jgi:hypothetical protein
MPDSDLWDVIEHDGNSCCSSGKYVAKQLKMLSETNETKFLTGVG